jgi:hypothetical protein
MKFEDLPEGADYKHRIAFEAGEEVEAVGSAYRELVVMLAEEDKVDTIKKHELTFSTFDTDAPNGILVDNPETVASVLDDFHKRTEQALARIAYGVAVPFESDAIARRIKLGEVAEQLAGLIRGEFRADDLVREIDEHGPALFTGSDDISAD